MVPTYVLSGHTRIIYHFNHFPHGIPKSLWFLIIVTRGPYPEEPHAIILPPPNFTLGTIQSGKYTLISPGNLQNPKLPSVWQTGKCDLSLPKTHLHWTKIQQQRVLQHSIWRLAHWHCTWLPSNSSAMKHIVLGLIFMPEFCILQLFILQKGAGIFCPLSLSIRWHCLWFYIACFCFRCCCYSQCFHYSQQYQ